MDLGDRTMAEHTAAGRVDVWMTSDDRERRARMGAPDAFECGQELGPSLALPVHADEQDVLAVARVIDRARGNARIRARTHADHACGVAAVVMGERLRHV